jgi:3-deoxy-D-manno-octulosonic-acid transferase
MIWILYNICFAVGYLLMVPKFLLRMRKRGGYQKGFLQRLGIYPARLKARLSERRRIWIHAVSVGEIYVALRFIKSIRAVEPGTAFVLTTTTSTGHQVAARALPEDDILLYFPMDFPFIARRAVRRLNPRLLLLTENELWPNLLREAKKRGVPVALINGRISSSSYLGYRKIRWMTRPALRLVDLFLVQADVDRSRLLDMGADPGRVRVVGSVKYDVAEDDPGAEAKAREILGQAGIAAEDLVLLGGSTWPGEERVLLEAYQQLKARFPALRLVLVPRHMERRAEVEAEVARAGETGLLRSRLKTGEEKRKEGVLIVDTTGELKTLYAGASVIFVGKSLASTGGQNIIEPALFGKAIVVGPHLENFPDVAADFTAAKAMVQVQDAEELIGGVESLLADQALREEYGKRARALVEHKRGTIEASVRMVLELLPSSRP